RHVEEERGGGGDPDRAPLGGETAAERQDRRERERDREVADVAGVGAGLLPRAGGLEGKGVEEAAALEERYDGVDGGRAEERAREPGAAARDRGGGAEGEEEGEDRDRPQRIEGEGGAGGGEGGDEAEEERDEGEGRPDAARSRPRGEEIPRPRPVPIRPGKGEGRCGGERDAEQSDQPLRRVEGRGGLRVHDEGRAGEHGG